MNDTTYFYDAYSPQFEDTYIIKSDTQLTLGTWVMDKGDSVEIRSAYQPKEGKKAYQPTNTIEYTLYPEISLIIIVLLALFILVSWLIRKWHKASGKRY